jgi:hypothetical protein
VNINIQRTAPLSEKELYLFDTMGLLRLPGFLSPGAVDQCRTEVLRLPPRVMAGRGDKVRFDELVAQSPIFDEMARSVEMRQCIEPLINQPYRLIESYALKREQDSVFYLHNGNSEVLSYGDGRSVERNMSYNHTFHNGKLYCMFVKVLVYLSALRQEADGPFCYLQGSHKANWPWFPDLGSEKPSLTKQNFPSLELAYAEAGDAFLLNEALLHGTMPKTSGGERLVMAFSYAPAFVADWKAIDVVSDDIMKVGHY